MIKLYIHCLVLFAGNLIVGQSIDINKFVKYDNTHHYIGLKYLIHAVFFFLYTIYRHLKYRLISYTHTCLFDNYFLILYYIFCSRRFQLDIVSVLYILAYLCKNLILSGYINSVMLLTAMLFCSSTFY